MKRKRTALYKKQDGKCIYCGREVPLSDATVDHLNPRSKQGKNSIGNLVMACKPCNSLLRNFTNIHELNGYIKQVTPLIIKKQEIIKQNKILCTNP